MKKLVIGVCALFAVTVVSAEEMKFVTLLSQPVGSFAKLETLDQNVPSKIFNLNFCNTSVTTGTIDIQGLSYLQTVDVESGASVGGNVQNYSLRKILMKPTAVIEGGRAAINNAGGSGASGGPTHIQSTDTINYLGSGDVTTVVASLDKEVYLSGVSTKISNPENVTSSSVGWKNSWGGLNCDFSIQHIPAEEPTISYGSQTSAGGSDDTCDGNKTSWYTPGNYKDIPGGSCTDVNGSQKRTVGRTAGKAAYDQVRCAPGGTNYGTGVYLIRD